MVGTRHHVLMSKLGVYHELWYKLDILRLPHTYHPPPPCPQVIFLVMIETWGRFICLWFVSVVSNWVQLDFKRGKRTKSTKMAA